ncbi:MAG: hypothetical protein ACJZ4Z_03495 [Candidatus Thalassarchaeaceae archaeon]
MVEAFAPGKCILFGEHAVVYGHPAVAVAIEQGVNVSIEKFDHWMIDGKEVCSFQTPSYFTYSV